MVKEKPFSDIDAGMSLLSQAIYRPLKYLIIIVGHLNNPKHIPVVTLKLKNSCG